jgi:hypothetical protein
LAEDNISDLAGGQGGDIDAIPLAKVLQVKVSAKLPEHNEVVMLTARIKSFIESSTLIHSSSDRVGQTKWGSVMVFLSG